MNLLETRQNNVFVNLPSRRKLYICYVYLQLNNSTAHLSSTTVLSSRAVSYARRDCRLTRLLPITRLPSTEVRKRERERKKRKPMIKNLEFILKSRYIALSLLPMTVHASSCVPCENSVSCVSRRLPIATSLIRI